jgi:hypothetical protein
LLSVIYIHDLPPILRTSSIAIIFADDASVIIYGKNLDDFCMLSNKLSLNLEKANVMNFITKNSPQYPLNVGYNDKYIEEGVNTEFLGLQSDNHLNWKNHIDQLIPKPSRACYAVRFMLHIININALKIYFACFHSLMKNEIIF